MRDNNDGFTIVEALAAFVIVTILLLVLAQGITTASSWFAEGDRIKNEGETVADSVEGKDDTEVETSVVPNDSLSLDNDKDGNVTLGKNNTKTKTYSYKDSDVSMKHMETQVKDNFGSTTYYQTTTDNADDTVENMTSFWKSIPTMSQQERAQLGLSGGYSSNNSAIIGAWLKQGNSFPTISRTFINKHGMESGGHKVGNLYIRVTFYNVNQTKGTAESLIYACETPDFSGQPWKAMMFYIDGYWYLSPRAKMPSMNYTQLTISSGATLPNVTDVTTDSYGNKHVTTSGNTTIRVTGSQPVINYVTDSKNGWTKLLPITD